MILRVQLISMLPGLVYSVVELSQMLIKLGCVGLKCRVRFGEG